MEKVNGVDVSTSLFRGYIEGTTRSIVAPFENGITIRTSGFIDYVYYKKI